MEPEPHEGTNATESQEQSFDELLMSDESQMLLDLLVPLALSRAAAGKAVTLNEVWEELWRTVSNDELCE